MRSRQSTRPLPADIEQERPTPGWLENSPGHVKELSERVTELSTLMGVSSLLSVEQPLPEALESVCRLTTEICKAQVSFIHLIDGEDDPVCVGRNTPADSLQYAWEGIARIYGRKAIQKEEIASCSNLLLRRESEPQDPQNPRLGGVCAVPLRGRSRIVGALTIGYPDSHRFSAREKDMLNAIGAQVAMAVERSWLLDQMQGQLARANSLRDAATQIASNLELDTVLDAIVNHASVILAGEFSAIFLADRPSAGGEGAAGRGKERGRVHGCPVHLEDSPLGNAIHRAIETGRPAIAQSLLQHDPVNPPSEIKPNDYRAALAVPLLSGPEVLGALAICYLERRRFDPSDISLAEDFAGQAALAIRNARLYEDAMANWLGLEAAINQINNHGICLLDDQLNITFTNSATFWLLGLSPRKSEASPGEWTAVMKRALVAEADLEPVLERIRANPEETVVAKLEARGTAGSSRVIKLLSLPVRQADGTIHGRVNLMEEAG